MFTKGKFNVITYFLLLSIHIVRYSNLFGGLTHSFEYIIYQICDLQYLITHKKKKRKKKVKIGWDPHPTLNQSFKVIIIIQRKRKKKDNTLDLFAGITTVRYCTSIPPPVFFLFFSYSFVALVLFSYGLILQKQKAQNKQIRIWAKQAQVESPHHEYKHHQLLTVDTSRNCGGGGGGGSNLETKDAFMISGQPQDLYTLPNSGTHIIEYFILFLHYQN